MCIPPSVPPNPPRARPPCSLRKAPSARPRAAELLQHEFVRERDGEASPPEDGNDARLVRRWLEATVPNAGSVGSVPGGVVDGRAMTLRPEDCNSSEEAIQRRDENLRDLERRLAAINVGGESTLAPPALRA